MLAVRGTFGSFILTIDRLDTQQETPVLTSTTFAIRLGPLVGASASPGRLAGGLQFGGARITNRNYALMQRGVFSGIACLPPGDGSKAWRHLRPSLHSAVLNLAWHLAPTMISLPQRCWQIARANKRKPARMLKHMESLAHHRLQPVQLIEEAFPGTTSAHDRRRRGCSATTLGGRLK